MVKKAHFHTVTYADGTVGIRCTSEVEVTVIAAGSEFYKALRGLKHAAKHDGFDLYHDSHFMQREKLP